MKKFRFLILAVIAAAVGLGFAACGGDDDDDPKGGGSGSTADFASLIVGEWSENGSALTTVDYNNYGYKFSSNGTYKEYCSGIYTGTYKVEGGKLYLYEDDYYDTEVYNILELTATKMVLQVEDEPDDVVTFIRVGSSASGDVVAPSDIAKMLLGTWTWTGKYEGVDDYNNYGFIFRANGICAEIGSGYSETTYKLNGRQLLIYDDYYDEHDEYYIVELTESKLVLRDMDDPEYGDETYFRVK